MMRGVALPVVCVLSWLLSACGTAEPVSALHVDEPAEIAAAIESLQELSIDTFRARKFHSEVKIETRLDIPCVNPDKVRSLPEAKGGYASYMASYMSDGLRVYTRINIPYGPAPESGFPVIIFAHGWVGVDAAPSYTLGCDPASMYSEITDAYARAGFLVFIPGYRGHATVNNVPGDGVDYIKAWDNGTYLSTIFYAVDVLNLLGGLKTSGILENPLTQQSVNYQTDAFNLAGHSQGGDVALTVLAATGEGAANGLAIENASIWSGTFADRLTQMRTYHPLQKTPEAFLSGDGDWTGSAVGVSGEVNPNFIFAYPPDWIETPHPKDWTWQKDTWSFPSVKAVLTDSLTKTYETLNASVGDIDNAAFRLSESEDGRVIIEHDRDVAKDMNRIGGYNFADYVKEPLILHFPDRDFYSLPAWNFDLCARVNAVEGDCHPFQYAGNTHGMRLSKHEWFSGVTHQDGYAAMAARDVTFFKGGDPQTITFPAAPK